jgi:hypothetical protein
MRLYRIKHVKLGRYYRHCYAQFRGGDFVPEESATVWTTAGGVNGALGSLRHDRAIPNDCLSVEIADVEPTWRVR